MTGAIIQQTQEDLAKTSKEYAIVIMNSNITTTQHQFNNAEIAIVCAFLVGCYQLIFGE